ncbi:MAG: low molecular weight protein-tyrosine-phosphatase [Bacillota bacterium]
MANVQILFVCMGNICRSPTAEGIMRQLIENAGMQNRIVVDSAGTHGYHVGEPPDPRAIAAAQRRGYDLSMLRARELRLDDFERFDLLLAMDFNNLDRLQTMCPAAYESKLGMLMEYSRKFKTPVVPDPYYRGSTDFGRVLDYVEDACKGLMLTLVQSHAALERLSARAARPGMY